MSHLSSHRSKRERSSLANIAKARHFLDAGQFAEAELYFTRAVDADKSSSAALMNLGDFYFRRQEPVKAQTYFARITALEPKNEIAWRNLGVSCASACDHQKAAEAFQQAVRLAPEYTNAVHGLALSLMALGRPLEAIPHFQHIISRTPQDHEALFNFANALVKIGELNAAEAAFQVAIAAQPGFAVAHCNLGQLYFSRGQTQLAITHLSCAINITPNFFEAHNNLGAAYQREGQLGLALDCYQTAATLRPDFAEAHSNIGSVQLALGNLAAAAKCYRHSLSIKPDNAAVFSDLLFCLQSDESISNAQLFAAHREFAAHFEAPLRQYWPAHTNLPDPARKLRIGYVSGDLRNHAIAFFIEPTLAAHDRTQFEIILYSNHAQFDAVSKRLSQLVDRWTSVLSLNDDALAAQIRDDGIDILIDLSGHTAGNRLLTFARKPAPVQTAWMGYGGTTGLEAMDYRITDEWHDPAGLTDPFNSEKLVRLATGSAAFQFVKTAPPVGNLPALAGHGITLACLNSPRKIRPRVVALWSRILAAHPDASLMLFNSSDAVMVKTLLAQFNASGVDSSRIVFQPWMALPEYLALHSQIDLALDPFPYNGCTTSLHALWMGVPYVTLAGDRAVSRVGAGMLAFAGLEDWITHSEQAYFERVQTALSDLPALNVLRNALRTRLETDALDRPLRITRELEWTYRTMWQKWCDRVR